MNSMDMERGIISIENGEPTLTSMAVAKLIGKKHCDFLKDIKIYCGYLAESNIPLGEYFIDSFYFDKQSQKRHCFKITKKGCEICANKLRGKKGVLFTTKYVDIFNSIKNKLDDFVKSTTKQDSYAISDPIKRAERWIEEEKERQRLIAINKKQEHNKIIEQGVVEIDNIDNIGKPIRMSDKPKSYNLPTSAILIRQLSKLLSQRGVDNCGEKRLFKSLRENGYLIKAHDADYNSPTQKSLDKGLLVSVRTGKKHSHYMSYTTRVTKTGVKYFMDKYINGELTL